MSDQNIGIIIGGVIAILASLITAAISFVGIIVELRSSEKRWKIEKRIERLNVRKQEALELEKRIKEHLMKGLSDDTGEWSTDMMLDLHIFFPDEVYESFSRGCDELRKLKDSGASKERRLKVQKGLNATVSGRMKNFINELSKEIDELLEVK